MDVQKHKERLKDIEMPYFHILSLVDARFLAPPNFYIRLCSLYSWLIRINILTKFLTYQIEK